MSSETKIRILVDAREFIHGRFTGIARVLQGMTVALSESSLCEQLALAVHDTDAVIPSLKHHGKVTIVEIPKAFLMSEKALSHLSHDFDLYISPYPKFPLFGCHSKAAHIVHDVLDLTHPLYRKRMKVLFDAWRLKRALRRADLTWYDSFWSMEEAKQYAGYAGKNPRVRYPGIDEAFQFREGENHDAALGKYGLTPGYVLAIGNGLPHKNLGVIMEIADEIPAIVFAGVSGRNQQYWRRRFPRARVSWIPCIGDTDLPAVMRGSFCLVQPSVMEGYGYPPLEAIACGVPAVVSNIPVLMETTGGSALAADPRNPKTWLQKLDELKNHNVYQAQVEKGLKWVEPLRGQKAWEPYIADIRNFFERS